MHWQTMMHYSIHSFIPLQFVPLPPFTANQQTVTIFVAKKAEQLLTYVLCNHLVFASPHQCAPIQLRQPYATTMGDAMMAHVHQRTRRTHSFAPMAWVHSTQWRVARLTVPDLGHDREGATPWLSPSQHRLRWATRWSRNEVVVGREGQRGP